MESRKKKIVIWGLVSYCIIGIGTLLPLLIHPGFDQNPWPAFKELLDGLPNTALKVIGFFFVAFILPILIWPLTVLSWLRALLI